MLELSSSMRAMARPPSSPKLSPATPNHVTTERPNGTLQHTLITTLPPFNQKPMSATALRDWMHVLMCHHSATFVFRSRAPHIALQPEAPMFVIQSPFSFSAR